MIKLSSFFLKEWKTINFKQKSMKPSLSVTKTLFYNYQFPCYVTGVLFLFNALGDVGYSYEKGYMWVLEGFFKSGISFNKPSVFFMFFCTSITVSVQIFSMYYLPQCEVLLFSIVIYNFMALMILLTSGINSLSVFLGWEGVGVLSFVLIGWFSSREEAAKSAKKAILFNRVTDFFFLILILFEMSDSGFFFSTSDNCGFMKSTNIFWWMLIICSLSFILCSAGKSAQFMFHPWLTAAMEGPTPVSSLLHSSTMVVAGVWLYSLIFPFLQSGSWELSIIVISFSSSITLMASSYWAFSQFDLKKIIALSTTSQLSFMFLMISMGYIELAYLHMLFHGYFKAMLFMGSGVSIHSNSNSSQDLRKLSNSNSNPYLMVFFLLGNLGLMGVPFFGGFWSKHLILLSLSNPYWSLLSIFSIFFMYFASMITFGYSFKTLLLMTKSPTLMALSNYKYNMSMSHLYPEIIPTLFLGLFVVFFPSMYLLYSGFEEPYLSLVFSKLDFFIIILGGLMLVNLIIKPSSFGFVFSWSSNQILMFTSLMKNLIKFMKGSFLEGLILKKKIKSFLLFGISNKEDQFGFYHQKHPLIYFNKSIISFFFMIFILIYISILM